MSTITQAELRRVLHYDADTGAFTWLPRPLSAFASERAGKIWNKRFAGKRAGGMRVLGCYRMIAIHGMPHYEHRLAWLYAHGELPPSGKQIDHRNGRGLDNRIANLRVVTRSVNGANRRGIQSNNRSRCTGVCWESRRHRWRAQIQVNSKNLFLGYFGSFLDATAARRRAERQHFPEVFA